MNGFNTTITFGSFNFPVSKFGVSMSRQITQDEFDQIIGRLDYILSVLVLCGKGEIDIDEPNRQTLKHHAEDMVAAGQCILDRMVPLTQATTESNYPETSKPEADRHAKQWPVDPFVTNEFGVIPPQTTGQTAGNHANSMFAMIPNEFNQWGPREYVPMDPRVIRSKAIRERLERLQPTTVKCDDDNTVTDLTIKAKSLSLMDDAGNKVAFLDFFGEPIEVNVVFKHKTPRAWGRRPHIRRQAEPKTLGDSFVEVEVLEDGTIHVSRPTTSKPLPEPNWIDRFLEVPIMLCVQKVDSDSSNGYRFTLRADKDFLRAWEVKQLLELLGYGDRDFVMMPIAIQRMTR